MDIKQGEYIKVGYLWNEQRKWFSQVYQWSLDGSLWIMLVAFPQPEYTSVSAR